jgi:pimeloyl-ACP methyl ester carboxylesterase
MAWSPGLGEVRDGELRVRTAGSLTAPPVVLLHGLAGSGRYWGSGFDRVADDALLVIPDLLGFGDSPKPDAGYTVDDHARAVLACLSELGVAGPATLVGHSLGSLVALRVAALAPEAVTAVVAFGPPLFPEPAVALAHLGLMTRLFALDNVIAHALYEGVCGAAPGLAGQLARLLRPELPRPIAEDAVRYTWQSYSRTIRNVIVEGEAGKWLADVRVPVTLVAGAQDTVVDADYLAGLAEQHANVTLDRWAGGHHLPLSAPARCVELLRDVLRPASAH